MAAPPFMQLYVADFLADTQHLTTEEIGAYLLLLMTMWRNGGQLPHDQKALSRCARLSGRSWVAVWERLGPLFTVEGGSVTQKRLSQEFEKAVQKSEVRKQSGARGGAAKALKEKKPRVAKATGLPKHSSDIRDQNQKDLMPSAKPPARAAKSSIPDDFPHTEAKAAAVLFWQNKGRPDLAASVADQAAQFRDHHAARGGKMLDWAAAWRTWVRNALEFTRPPAGRPAPVQPAPEADGATWERRLVLFHEGDPGDEIEAGFWSAKWGPKPGEPGCQVPKAALDAYAARKRPGGARGAG